MDEQAENEEWGGFSRKENWSLHKKTINRLAYLKRQGVDVRHGINAVEIDKIFAKERIASIHWNCPFDDPSHRKEFFPILPAFFRSAAKLQKIGDRVYIGLDQNEGYWKTRQGENPLLAAAALAGYRLVRKRNFDRKRYPGYQFQKTGSYERNTYAKEGREFVFEKVEEPPQKSDEMTAAVLRDYDGEVLEVRDEIMIEQVKNKIVQLMDPDKKEYRVGVGCEAEEKGGEFSSFYYVCSTDGGSSQ